MDKALLNRLAKLEQKIDIGEARTASSEALLDYLTGHLGYVPTEADLERLAVEAPAAEEPEE